MSKRATVVVALLGAQMRRPLIVLAIATLVAGLAAAPAAAQVAATHHGSAAKEYTPPPIHFGPCTTANSGGNAATLQHFGAQCGYVVVPLNYAHPNGRKIKLAISRVLHTTTSPSQYKGIMLVNPGGPGGSGLVYSVLPQAFGLPNHAGDGYDWIGWDPRGVGNSIPSLSCEASFFHGDRPAYRPTTSKIMRQWVSRSKRYAAKCTQANGAALFNHVKTVDSVRDMESIRIALGQQKINYYGFSYGTYLGSVYMSLHPNRVGRFVLDSTVDPRNVWYQANLNQDVAFQKTFDVYFGWLAKFHSVYHVGATHDAVRDLFLNTETRLNAHPAGGVLGGDELLDVFTNAAYYVYGWEDIAAAYSKYIHTGDASDLIAMYQDANPTTPGGDNSYAMYLATQCTDAAWPQSQNRLNRDSWRLDATYDYFTWANAWFNGPCAYWKYPHSQPVDVTGAKVHVPVLMIDETFDPATPYEGSLYVRSIFPTASLIEGLDGTTHAGSLSGVACTDDTIANYLATGVVPARKNGNQADKVCPPVPQPDPTASDAPANSSMSASTRAVAATLRRGIEALAVRG
jgi:pimeloyl-ACP methyl ester carboxylesterase